MFVEGKEAGEQWRSEGGLEVVDTGSQIPHLQRIPTAN